MRHIIKKQQAFTLLELSLVIAIIAVIAGSVLAGKSLMRGAELRGVMRDAESYAIAINTFKQKYSEIPGDFSQANAMWSAASNGDGNGQISSTASNTERWQAWLHLSLAELIDQRLSGAAAGSNNSYIGRNVPSTSVKEGGFSFINAIPTGSANDTRLVLLFGGPDASGPTTSANILTPTDAQSIDKKADDGSPSSGMVRANTIADPNTCQITDVSSNIPLYNVGSELRLCALQFILATR